MSKKNRIFGVDVETATELAEAIEETAESALEQVIAEPEEEKASDPEPAPAFVEESRPERVSGVVINAEFVNVRRQANMSSDAIAQLRKGTEITIVNHIVDWFEVELADGRRGYISHSFCKKK